MGHRHLWSSVARAVLLSAIVGIGVGAVPARGVVAQTHPWHPRGVLNGMAQTHQALPSGLRRALFRDAMAHGTRGGLHTSSALSGITWSQQAEISATDATGFGYSVAVDGSTAVIGAPNSRVYIYVASGSTWTLQQEIISPATGFGHTVSVSEDTAVIGAMRESFGTGAAYVYVRSGSTWTLQATLHNPRGRTHDEFGAAVAIEGNTLVATSPGTPIVPGAGYVYVRSGSTWHRQATLNASDARTSDAFGTHVALSGNTVLIPAESWGGNVGTVYMFVRSSTGGTTTWSQQAQIPAPSCCFYFGWAVALSGNTALLGVPGVAYVFVRSGSTWSQQEQLSSPPDGPSFGEALALSGTTAVVGAGQARQGTAYVYVQSGSTWTQQAELQPSDEGGAFGWAVAVSGNTAVIGAVSHNPHGAAYVFARLAPLGRDILAL